MSWMVSRARRRPSLTCIQVCKLALQSKVVSLPPEKIRLTAAAELKITVMILRTIVVRTKKTPYEELEDRDVKEENKDIEWDNVEA